MKIIFSMPQFVAFTRPIKYQYNSSCCLSASSVYQQSALSSKSIIISCTGRFNTTAQEDYQIWANITGVYRFTKIGPSNLSMTEPKQNLYCKLFAETLKKLSVRAIEKNVSICWFKKKMLSGQHRAS
jgi:hypothetical protein